jgi:EpsI family protein
MVYKDLDRDEPFNRVIIQKGMVKQIVYYWFDERGRKITNEWWAKYYLLLDAITMNRTDGALVRLATQVFPGETEAAADKRLQTFMKDALPTLAHFLPAGAIIKQAHHEPLGLQSLGVLRTLT